MVQYAETQHALDGGASKIDPEKGVALIEKWEEALKDVDLPAGKAIAKDLGALKKTLSSKTPDKNKIGELLKSLGSATTGIANQADGAAPAKLKALGKSLSSAK